MPNFHEYLDRYVGVFLILCGLCVILFPPKFGNVYYGFVTNLTEKNEELWIIGQKLFAISTIIMGVIFFTIGGLNVKEQIPGFVKVLLLVGLWKISKYIVHKILIKLYPSI